MVSEDVAAILEVDTDPNSAFAKMQVAQIPPDLIPYGAQIMQDIREQIGFSRNQLGEFQTRRGDTSATEAAIVNQGSEIRVDERRDIMADMIRRMVEKMNKIIFTQWDGEQVVEVVGPGGAQVWVRVQPALLAQGRYNVKVDPDSTVPKTRQERESRAGQIYKVLKENPLMDPIKLTKFLLTELEGVEMDDLMKALPQLDGGVGTPGSPLEIGQFAQLISNSTQRAGQNPGQLAGALAGAGGT